MSPEKLSQGPEKSSGRTAETSPDQSAEQSRRLEALEQAGAAAAEQQPEQAAAARKRAERLAVEPEQGDQAPPAQPFAAGAKADSKKRLYRQSLEQIRSRLPNRRSRAFSKVIHQPVIEKTSEVVGKTILRPAVTLGVALGALVGGSGIYIYARHYGFEVSGSEFLLSGVAGGLIGLLVDGILSLGKRVFKRSQT